jgi:hypothetical protein
MTMLFRGLTDTAVKKLESAKPGGVVTASKALRFTRNADRFDGGPTMSVSGFASNGNEVSIPKGTRLRLKGRSGDSFTFEVANETDVTE